MKITAGCGRGGSEVETITEFIGELYELPETEPSKARFKFMGWFNSEDVRITSETIASTDFPLCGHSYLVPDGT